MNKLLYFLVVIVLLPLVCKSRDGFTSSRAAYYVTPDGYGTTSGACGYGELGRNMNDAKVAAVSKLWRNGTGCGTCYQVKCTIPKVCNEKGVVVAVTDYGEGDGTDFIMNKPAFGELARPGAEEKVISYGVVHILYKRVPCRHRTSNVVVVKVDDNSRFPDYLSILLLNVSGVNDVLALETKGDKGRWREMRRAYGAVFDQPMPPRGPLSVRVLVHHGTHLGVDRWKQSTDVIPLMWKPGDMYNSTFHLN